MRLVILESPYAGEIDRNLAYARAAVRDCLKRGESPIASHLLFTQPGILNDLVPEERALGIEAGFAWYRAAECSVFYLDMGMSRGMKGAADFLEPQEFATEFRFLNPENSVAKLDKAERLAWEWGLIQNGPVDKIAETPIGRLTVEKRSRPPTKAAPFLVSLLDQPVAYYASIEAARAGGELYVMAMMGKARTASPAPATTRLAPGGG